jgi:hypothetical protein
VPARRRFELSVVKVSNPTGFFLFYLVGGAGNLLAMASSALPSVHRNQVDGILFLNCHIIDHFMRE